MCMPFDLHRSRRNTCTPLEFFLDMIIIGREEVEFNSKLNDTCPDWKMYGYSGRARIPPCLRPHG